jgi:hypothetical protein
MLFPNCVFILFFHIKHLELATPLLSHFPFVEITFFFKDQVSDALQHMSQWQPSFSLKLLQAAFRILPVVLFTTKRQSLPQDSFPSY